MAKKMAHCQRAASCQNAMIRDTFSSRRPSLLAAITWILTATLVLPFSPSLSLVFLVETTLV